VLLVHEHITVAGLAVLHPDERLVDLSERPLLDPALDLMLRSNLEHLADIVRGSDEASGDVEVPEDERDQGDGWHERLRNADLCAEEL
jgi:hypothetical protein